VVVKTPAEVSSGAGVRHRQSATVEEIDDEE